MSEIYRAEVLEHANKPKNFGVLKKPSHQASVFNSFCGDAIDIYIDIKDKKISKVRFRGKGCILSVASASLFTEWIKGKYFSYILKSKPQQVIKKLKLTVSPGRRKCVLLVYEALNKALSSTTLC